MVFSTSKPSVSGIQQGSHFSQAVPFLLMDFQPQIPKFVLFCDSSAWKFWFYFIGQQISKLGKEVPFLDNTSVSFFIILGHVTKSSYYNQAI